MEVRRSTYIKPAKLMLFYITIMPLLFLYSIFRVDLNNRGLFIVFLLICNLFAYFGFRTGAFNIKLINFNCQTQFNVKRFINALFWVALIVSIPKYMLYTGDHSFSVTNKLISLVTGRITFLESYNERQAIVAATGIWRLLNYLIIIIGPLHWLYMPLSMFFWKELSKLKKIGTIFIIFLYVFQYISCGASVGFVHFAIFLVSTLLIKDCIKSDELRFKNRIRKLNREKRRRFIILIVLVIIMIIGFGTIMNDRASGYEKTAITVGTQTVTPNEKGVIWNMIPKGYRSTAVSLYAYLLKPYAALDMGLAVSNEVDIPLCFGAGGSWFLADNVKDLLGYDVIAQTYNMRIDERFGYNYYTQWHTVYVWLANDFTFIGVPIALFILMCIFGLAWRDFLNNRNIFAFAMVILFVEFVFFIPMNNQVFQHSETLIAFWGSFIAWLITRRKYCFVER